MVPKHALSGAIIVTVFATITSILGIQEEVTFETLDVPAGDMPDNFTYNGALIAFIVLVIAGLTIFALRDEKADHAVISDSEPLMSSHS